LSINDMVADSLIGKDADSSLILVYRYLFNGVHFDEILRIPDTTLTKSLTLKTINLGTRVIKTSITLGQIARSNGSQGALILAAHGLSMPIPAIANTSGGVMDLDATDLFETIDIKTGNLIADIYNDMPIELNNVILELRNKVSGSVILNDTIAVILPNQTFHKTYPLDNKTFEGQLEAEVVNINDAVDLTITIKVDEVSAATAIFPAQNLVDQTDDVQYVLNGPELKFMQVKTGLFKFIVSSTMQDSAFMTYSIPGATYKGITPLYLEWTIPPAPVGDTVYLEKSLKVDDYWYDLTGKGGAKYNSFEQELILRIDSTGKMMHLSLNDSFYIFYTLYDVIPEYVSGYLGQDSFYYKGSVPIDFFDRIQIDELKVKDLKIKLFVENGVGADAELIVSDITATNTKKGISKSLSASNLSNAMNIGRALDHPFTPTSSTRQLSNSNAKELLELLPNTLQYEIDVRINPNGNAAGYTDFIYHDSKVEAGLEFELPLVFSSKGLLLRDTMDFDLSSQELVKSIVSGEFNLYVENKFPLSANLQIYFVDEDFNKLDSLFALPAIVEAGVTQGPQKRVYQFTENLLEVAVPEQKMQNMRDARHVLIEAVLNSRPDGELVKIYEDYQFNVKVVADFVYAPKL